MPAVTVADMSTTVGENQAIRPPVLLWDLDNMSGQRWQTLSLARALSLSVPDPAPRYAAARRPTWRRAQRPLGQFGFEVLSGGRSTSGADRRLCDMGSTLKRQGYRTFVVVSNDHYFTRLAKAGELHVVTLDRAHLSARLVEAAQSITVLTFNGTGWIASRD